MSQFPLQKEIDVHLVAFDVVSFSRNLDNQDGLFLDRKELTDAIKNTALFTKAIADGTVFAQFLGDEFRLAFRQKPTQVTEVLRFAKDVFAILDTHSQRAPTVRAIVLSGSVKCKEFRNYRYIDGDLVYTAADLLGAHVSQGELASEVPFHESKCVVDEPKKLFKTVLSDRRIEDAPRIEIFDPSGQHPFFVFACGLTDQKPSPSVTDALKTIIDAALSQTKRDSDSVDVTLSISPNGLIVAFKDDDFERARDFQESLQRQATTVPGFSAALTKGSLRLVDEDHWLGINVEGPAPIITCRILGKLKPAQFAFTEEVKSKQDPRGARKVTLNGKRGELFEVYLRDNYFGVPAHSQTKTSSAGEVRLPTAAAKSPPYTSILKTTLDRFTLVPDSTQNILRLGDKLPSQNMSSFVPLVVALICSGLDLEAVSDGLRANSPERSFEGFAVRTVFDVIKTEIAMWKQFHSILGPLRNYCGTAARELGRDNDGTSGDPLKVVEDAFQTAAIPFVPQFSKLAFEIVNDGYHNLVRAFDSAGACVNDRTFENVTVLLEEPRDPMHYLDEADRASAAITRVSNKLCHAITSEVPYAKLLQNLVRHRENAAKVGVRFATALNVLSHYLSNSFEREEAENKTLKLARPRLYKRIAERIRKEDSDRIVALANTVIFDWIELVGLLAIAP
jgi:hypothetical protein